MRKLLPLLVMASSLFGCVSVGVQCQSGSANAWVKVHRMGWGISKNQTENMAQFKAKVCP